MILFLVLRRPPRSTPFPYTTLFRSMAMVLAATEPALVARIVLNDVGPEVDPAGLARIRGYAGKTAPVKSWAEATAQVRALRSEEHTSELQSRRDLVCRLLLEKKK